VKKRKKATPPAPAPPSLDEIRARSEAYLEAVTREEYLFASGLKPETDLFDIEESYADLASPASIQAVTEALGKARGDEAQRTFHLLNFLLELLMEAQVGALQARLYSRQGKATLKIRRTSLPFRRSQTALAAEQDRVVRLLIGSEQHRVFASLNPILLSILKTLHATSSKLNRGGHLELCGRRIGVNLKALGEAADKFLAETRELYLEQMERAARERLGLGLDDLRREDMAFMLGGSEFDDIFPGEGMVSTAEAIPKGLGLDPTAGGRVAYDLEEREGKSHRACAYMIRVPDEVVVSLRPKAGPAALRQLLEEVGQALHRSAVDPSLPFEYRCLGFPAVFQASGHLFGRLLLDPGWLSKRHGAGRRAEPLLASLALKEVYFLRLLATQFRYEMALHQSATPEKMDVVFADMIAEHCSVRFAPEAYLYLTDFHLNSARYLKGLLLESVLRRRLAERFGRDWFSKRDVGGFLRDLWKGGGRLSYADAMERLGGSEADFSPLVEDVRQLFR
jgi:hypothetical protein